jgi:hypothetical protein
MGAVGVGGSLFLDSESPPAASFLFFKTPQPKEEPHFCAAAVAEANACFRSAAVMDLACCTSVLFGFDSSYVEERFESRPTSAGVAGLEEGFESIPRIVFGSSMVEFRGAAVVLSIDAFEALLLERPFDNASAIADSFGGDPS